MHGKILCSNPPKGHPTFTGLDEIKKKFPKPLAGTHYFDRPCGVRLHSETVFEFVGVVEEKVCVP